MKLNRKQSLLLSYCNEILGKFSKQYTLVPPSIGINGAILRDINGEKIANITPFPTNQEEADTFCLKAAYQIGHKQGHIVGVKVGKTQLKTELSELLGLMRETDVEDMIDNKMYNLKISM